MYTGTVEQALGRDLTQQSSGSVRLVLSCQPADRLRASPQGAHSREQYLELICAGGYPAALDYSAAQRRRWHRDCLHTVVQRDIVELDDVRRSDAIAPILETVAALTGQDLNVASARVSSAGRNVAVATTLAGLEYRR